MVNEIRKKCPGTGTRKLQKMLSVYYGLDYGRDRLFALLRRENMLIRCRQRSPRTTYSGHIFPVYPNLVAELVPTRPNQIWASDITYIRVGDTFWYLFLITDLYSRKIVGWALAEDMSSKHALHALTMAIGQKTDLFQKTIHHSDKGSQYCCWRYVELLRKHNISISMTQKGDPRENAYAERVNGIIKNEFIKPLNPNHQTIVQITKQAIENYNNFRLHLSIDWMTPEEAHTKTGEIARRWKNYPWYRKLESETIANFAPTPPIGDTSVRRRKPETAGASSPDSLNTPSRLNEPIPV